MPGFEEGVGYALAKVSFVKRIKRL